MFFGQKEPTVWTRNFVPLTLQNMGLEKDDNFFGRIDSKPVFLIPWAMEIRQ